jgi:signal transduction histidine kinase
MKAGAETALSRKRTIGEYTTYLTDTLEEVNALTSLAEDLLTLAKTDTIAFQKTAVDLSQLLAQQVRVMRPYAQKKNVTLSEKTVQDAVTVFGSEQYLRRTCANLIKNAVDYNRPGGGVTVSLAARGGNAVLSVSDTGIGIAEKDLPHVFERFYKADAARSVGAGGSGLGLAIVRDIVSAHNGSVHIDSTEGKGTTVVVTFPLA